MGYVDVTWADDTVAWFAAEHNCTVASTFSTKQALWSASGSHSSLATVGVLNYSNCDQGSHLTYYRISGGGHTVPGAPYVWSGLGPFSGLNSIEAMWHSWTGQPSSLPLPKSGVGRST